MSGTSESKKRKMFTKNQVRVSKTGRHIKTPKHIVTTSDEEPPSRKKKASSLGEKMEKLKFLADKLQLKNATLPKGKESAAGANCSKPSSHKSVELIALKHQSADGAGCNETSSHKTVELIASEHQFADGAGCSKTSSHETVELIASKYQSVDGAGCSKTSSHKTLELNDSEHDLNQTNHINMSEQSKVKRHKDLKNPTNNSSVTQSSVSGDLKFAELYESGILEDPLIDTNIDNSKQPETFIDVPVININNGSCAGCGQILDKLQVLETNVDKMSQQNTEIIKVLRQRFCNEQLSNKLYQNLEGYPITTVERFRHLDDKSNKEERQKVHDHLIRLGGLTLKEFLNIAMRQIMTGTLVLNYTWHKQKETEKFGDTRVSNVFYQAAVNCPLFTGPENKTVYKAAMLLVFKATKQRCRKKLNTNKHSKLENKVDAAIANISSLLRSESDLSGSEGDVEDVDDDSSSHLEENSDLEDENFI